MWPTEDNTEHRDSGSATSSFTGNSVQVVDRFSVYRILAWCPAATPFRHQLLEREYIFSGRVETLSDPIQYQRLDFRRDQHMIERLYYRHDPPDRSNALHHIGQRIDGLLNGANGQSMNHYRRREQEHCRGIRIIHTEIHNLAYLCEREVEVHRGARQQPRLILGYGKVEGRNSEQATQEEAVLETDADRGVLPYGILAGRSVEGGVGLGRELVQQLHIFGREGRAGRVTWELPRQLAVDCVETVQTLRGSPLLCRNGGGGLAARRLHNIGPDALHA